MKKALVIGTGIEVEHARALAKEFKVDYWTHYFTSFPSARNYLPGVGYPEINKIDALFLNMDSYDLVATYDIGWGDLIHWLRQKGKTCFGAGLGEKLETDRWWAKELMKKAKLDVVGEKVVGIDMVKAKVKQMGKAVVKIHIFRGDMETVILTAGNVDDYMDNISATFGPISKQYEFIIEPVVDAKVEIGVDAIFSSKQGFLLPMMWGVEKGSAYAGVWTPEPPKWFSKHKAFMDKVLRNLDYRGFVSTEHRITQDGKNYLIDFTTRIPHPLGHLFPNAIKNYCEVIWKVARGEKVWPEVDKRFWVVVNAYTEEQKTMDVPVVFPEKLAPWVKISYGFKVGDRHYAPKGGAPACTVVVGDNSLNRARDLAVKVMEQVEIVRKDDNVDSLNKAVEDLMPFLKQENIKP